MAGALGRHWIQQSQPEKQKIRGIQGYIHEASVVLKISIVVTIYMSKYPPLSVVTLQYVETNKVVFC